MASISAFLLVALSTIAVKATNITGDPTDLANYPPCAQKCIPLGLTAPVSCNSLSNITCICQNPAFTLAIANCEATTCTTEESNQIDALSAPLCAPVGGLSADVITALSSHFATISLTASGLATYPADATAATAVSAVLATATPEPNIGNPANILTYPQCAQVCNNESVPLATCDLTNIDCLCGSAFRSITAACQQITCLASDKAITQLLSEEVCGPVYQNNPSLGSAVSSAIASATSVAASVASKDPTKSTNWPLCAQKCQSSAIPASGCGSLANRTCVCKSPGFLNSGIDPCEKSTCNSSDLQLTVYLADSLCSPVGGVGNFSIASQSASTPTPTVFAGYAVKTQLSIGWIMMGLVGALGLHVML
ncbi:hypothetical protein BDR22DRAFT_891226 [Usnea florida]